MASSMVSGAILALVFYRDDDDDDGVSNSAQP
jgi:hypothetical protein